MVNMLIWIVLLSFISPQATFKFVRIKYSSRSCDFQCKAFRIVQLFWHCELSKHFSDCAFSCSTVLPSFTYSTLVQVIFSCSFIGQTKSFQVKLRHKVDKRKKTFSSANMKSEIILSIFDGWKMSTHTHSFWSFKHQANHFACVYFILTVPDR